MRARHSLHTTAARTGEGRAGRHWQAGRSWCRWGRCSWCRRRSCSGWRRWGRAACQPNATQGRRCGSTGMGKAQSCIQGGARTGGFARRPHIGRRRKPGMSHKQSQSTLHYSQAQCIARRPALLQGASATWRAQQAVRTSGRWRWRAACTRCGGCHHWSSGPRAGCASGCPWRWGGTSCRRTEGRGTRKRGEVGTQPVVGTRRGTQDMCAAHGPNCGRVRLGVRFKRWYET